MISTSRSKVPFRKEDMDYATVAKEFVAGCKSAISKEDCYVSNFAKKYSFTDLKKVQDVLYSIQDLDPSTRNCHLLVHRIVKELVKNHSSDWVKLAKQVDPNACGGAFIHGILEARLSDDPSFGISEKMIREVCGLDSDESSDRAIACAHMFGHLILVEKEGSIDQSLPICGKLNPTSKVECDSGIFMEDSFRIILSDHGLAPVPVKDEKRMIQQTQRCLNYKDEAGLACWTDLAEIYDEFYNYDMDKVYQKCNLAPEEGERQRCYLKAVVLSSISPSFNEGSKLVSQCDVYAESDLKEQCIKMVIGSLIHFSPKFSDRAKATCEEADSKYQKACFDEFNRLLKTIVNDKQRRAEFCEFLPQKLKESCL